MEFFPDRGSLLRTYGTLGDRLEDAKKVDAVWVVGQNFYNAKKNTKKISRLLLPHPKGDAFLLHCRQSDYERIIPLIEQSTKEAIKSGTKVRWYNPFISQMINIVDYDDPDCYVHIEIVLPFSLVDNRPCFTVFYRQSPDTVKEFQRVFDEMWHQAEDPEMLTNN